MGRFRRFAATLIALTLLTQFVPARLAACVASGVSPAVHHHSGCCHGADHACCHMSEAGSPSHSLGNSQKPCPCQLTAGKSLPVKPDAKTLYIPVAVSTGPTSVESYESTSPAEPILHATDSNPPPGGEHLPDLGRAPPYV